MRPSAGLDLPGYEYVRELGRGGMARVYLARQKALGRLVAVKILDLEDRNGHQQRIERFRREAELMARVSHPNILTIFDYGVIDGHPYLLMEYVEGGDLRRRMPPGRPLSLSYVRALLPPIRDALQCLHRLGILHRDLKPENILMYSEDNPKVADFGIAVLRAGNGTLTSTREFLGTDGYVAPEQRYRLHVDERADQYSLAALAYEMLTGERPLGIFKPPSEWNRHLDRSTDAVLARGLSDDPEDRYPGIGEFVNALLESLSTRKNRVISTAGRILPWVIAGITLILLLDHTLTSGRENEVQEAFQIQQPVEATSSQFRNSIGMEFQRVEPGEYVMGAHPSDPYASPDERPRHLVRISQPFYLGVYEVTVAQFRQFVDETGYRTVAETDDRGGAIWSSELKRVVHDPDYNWRNPGLMGDLDENQPVTQIVPEDAWQFCRWLSRKEGREYRLPTEAEWEFACRAGTTTYWYIGDTPDRLGEHAWYDANSRGILRPVGSKRPNPWGFYDVMGNAWELCSDRYGEYPEHPQTDPQGPDVGSRWVRRGGSWDSNESEQSARSSARSYKTYAYYTVGFRVVAEVSRIREEEPS